MTDRFNVRINCEIQRVDENGGWTNDRLSINDQMDISASSFLEVARVLGQFHDLAQSIRLAHENGDLQVETRSL